MIKTAIAIFYYIVINKTKLELKNTRTSVLQNFSILFYQDGKATSYKTASSFGVNCPSFGYPFSLIIPSTFFAFLVTSSPFFLNSSILSPNTLSIVSYLPLTTPKFIIACRSTAGEKLFNAFFSSFKSFSFIIFSSIATFL